MVIALLLCLAGTVATGVVAYGERGKGPLPADGAVFATVAHAEENEGVGGGEAGGAMGGKSIVGEVRGALANITLALVVLHLLNVGLASYAHRENLVPAILTSKKRTAK
jgi:cytochrome b